MNSKYIEFKTNVENENEKRNKMHEKNFQWKLDCLLMWSNKIGVRLTMVISLDDLFEMQQSWQKLC